MSNRAFHCASCAAEVTTLPTPTARDWKNVGDPNKTAAWTDRMKAEHGNGNGHGKSLHIEAQRLLPTPRVTTGNSIASQTRVRDVLEGRAVETEDCRLELTVEVQAHRGNWGQYAAAIHRWEALTRPAPPPTETGPKGNPRLSAAFSEWMMGLPAGWVTDVPGITRNEALKALGNGVVPQQAASALREMLAWSEAAA